MRIIVISDSHGNVSGVRKIFEKVKFDSDQKGHNSRCLHQNESIGASAKVCHEIERDTYLFYLGDGLDDIAEYLSMPNVYAVSGNCDSYPKGYISRCLNRNASIDASRIFLSVSNTKSFLLHGKKFLITHGNKFDVKKNINQLVQYAKSIDAEYVFYGHTHIQNVQYIDGIYFINPGSFSIKHNNGLVICIGDKVTIELLDLQKL